MANLVAGLQPVIGRRLARQPDAFVLSLNRDDSGAWQPPRGDHPDGPDARSQIQHRGRTGAQLVLYHAVNGLQKSGGNSRHRPLAPNSYSITDLLNGSTRTVTYCIKQVVDTATATFASTAPIRLPLC